MRAFVARGWRVLAIVSWAGLQAGEFRCSLCGHLGDEGELSFRAKDQVEQKELTLCVKCRETKPNCFLCSLPVPTGAVGLPDGRSLCPRDAQVAVGTGEELRQIAEEARVAIDRSLARFLTFPLAGVDVVLEDGPRMAAAVSGGGPRQCAYPMCRGVSRRAADGTWAHAMGMLSGQPRSWLALEFAHLLAHAWLAENQPAGRRLSGATVEAFCDLVAWRAAEELGLAGERKRLEASRLTEDQLTLLLEADRVYDFMTVMDWIRYGDDPRLAAGDTDRVRRLNEALKPAKAPERQVIPASPGQAAAPARLTLSGIVGTGQRRLALINDATLRQGEKGRLRLGDGVIEVQCLEIRADSVLLLVMATGEKLELKLKRPE